MPRSPVSHRAGRTLVITNDFPPRRGGIESFVASLCGAMAPDQVVVYTSSCAGALEYDRQTHFPVIRSRGSVLLPTPGVARRAVALMAEHECDRVLFGAAAPLGLLADRLRAGGAEHITALTHGHEVWWAALPGSRQALHRIGRGVDVMTYVSEYCRSRIAPAVGPETALRMRRLAPGVDTGRFRPGVESDAVRAAYDIEVDRPVVLSASRLIARKGHDVLLRAWPKVLARCPNALLLIVGDGPRRDALCRTVASEGLLASVRLAGAVDWATMPAVYAAADVFVVACRTRRAGLEPEALGIVFLEAASSGLPVVAGRSGGAPETVRDNVTGFIVDPRSETEIATRITELLTDPATARAMGRRGRAWVGTAFRVPDMSAPLGRLGGDGGSVNRLRDRAPRCRRGGAA